LGQGGGRNGKHGGGGGVGYKKLPCGKGEQKMCGMNTLTKRRWKRKGIHIHKKGLEVGEMEQKGKVDMIAISGEGEESKGG